RDDVGVDRARESAGESEAEAGALLAVAPGAAPDAGLEDPVALLGRDAGTIVLHGIDDARVLAPDVDVHARRAVAAGILEHGLDDPLGEVGIHPHPQCPRGMRDLELELSLCGEPAARTRRPRGYRIRVRRSSLAAGLVARRRDQRVDRARELVGVAVDEVK